MTVFETLNKINVNDHTEIKDTGSAKLTYLSWTWAWAEVKKIYPDASYKILRFENNLPYVYDEKTGYMVFTNVTIEGQTYEMWLSVMDGRNYAMKSAPYEVKTKYKTYTVAPATMTDINKTIMRCLVKNLAMFGLGLYIYAGEDLPEGEEPETVQKQQVEPQQVEMVKEREVELLTGLAKEKKVRIETICKTFGIASLNDMTMPMWVQATKMLENTQSKEGAA